MKEEYDFSQLKTWKNLHFKKLKKQVTVRLAGDTINYFKALSKETGITYHNLINLYLNDCAAKGKKLKFDWH